MYNCHCAFRNVVFIALWCLQKCCLEWPRFLRDRDTYKHTHSRTCIFILLQTLRWGMSFVSVASFSLHISCHCLLKNFNFPYLNMLIRPQLSFRATWYPLATKPQPNLSFFQSVCVSFCLSFKTETSESHQILPTRFSVWLIGTCCNICSSWGLYDFTGITQPAQTLPYERGVHTHTQGNLSLNYFSTWQSCTPQLNPAPLLKVNIRCVFVCTHLMVHPVKSFL